MARDRIQVQTGLSEAGFDEMCGSEEQCHAALVEWRWPSGFVCPDCGGGAHGVVMRDARRWFRRNARRKQTSVQAGTIFASSKPRAIVAKVKPTAPVFKWVNAALGAIKSALARTYRGVRQKHVARYLAEFEYRFNRKYKLEEMIPRLAFVALRTARMAYRLRKQADATA